MKKVVGLTMDIDTVAGLSRFLTGVHFLIVNSDDSRFFENEKRKELSSGKII